jgi:UDPglucose 6-dehydrogenase
MEITVVGGTGYVGLTTAACLAYKGHKVYCIGRDSEKVDEINKGVSIIYEEGLDEILKRVTSEKRLTATIDFSKPIFESKIIFLCVGTPSRKNGAIDLYQLKTAAKNVGKAIVAKKDYCIIVVKSTVVPGTTEEVLIPIIEKASAKKAGRDFGVCMNPEFLREGSAVKDCLYPEDQGIVIGEMDKNSGDVLYELYQNFDADIYRTTLSAAEMIKYARNSYLAKDISFINEIAYLCQKIGVDYLDVKRGMEMDSRIGKGRFLNAGLGFGGSCFPKDVKALIAKAKQANVKLNMLEATLTVNEFQPLLAVKMLQQVLGKLKSKKIAILGLAFKPGTDDMRESRSIPLINKLLHKQACINVFDPKAMDRAKEIFGDKIFYAGTAEEALKNANACIIATEWPQFSNPKLYNSSKCKIIIDGRRILDPKTLHASAIYKGIGSAE